LAARQAEIGTLDNMHQCKLKQPRLVPPQSRDLMVDIDPTVKIKDRLFIFFDLPLDL